MKKTLFPIVFAWVVLAFMGCTSTPKHKKWFRHVAGFEKRPEIKKQTGSCPLRTMQLTSERNGYSVAPMRQAYDKVLDRRASTLTLKDYQHR